MTEVSTYPFHFSDKYIYAFVFRRDARHAPILHSIRIRRLPRHGAFWNPDKTDRLPDRQHGEDRT